MGAPAVAAAGSGAAAAGAADWLEAAGRLHAWMHERDHCGHDPHDALASPLIARLALGSRWLGIAWTQLGKRSPPSLRRLLGVPAARNAKGVGLVVAACVRLARASGEPSWRTEAERLVRWLDANGCRDADTIGWGYPFAWANRDFHVPAHTPSGVATAFVGHALFDAAEAWGDSRAAELGIQAARFIQCRLRRVPVGHGFAFSYTPLDTRVVLNNSALAASLLARAAAATGEERLAADARHAAFTCAAQQRADGSWPYGITRRNGWTDSFHTGYLLVALDCVRRFGEAAALGPAIEAGVRYWREAFFTGPAVGYWPNRAWPVDQHAVAQAVLTLRTFAAQIVDARALAGRLGAWSLEEMCSPDGSFYYRRTRHRIERARYMRWTQAWMLCALAELADWDTP
jgi:hypothetical protein